MESKENRFFPMFVDISGKNIKIFGAGSIAFRRINTLLKFGVNITVISPVVSNDILDLSDKITIIKKYYSYGDCDDSFFVIACTDNKQTNENIYNECKDKNIIVNIADNKLMCDFQFPAVIENDDIVIAVNSGGKSHEKVRMISDNIRKLKRYIFEMRKLQ